MTHVVRTGLEPRKVVRILQVLGSTKCTNAVPIGDFATQTDEQLRSQTVPEETSHHHSSVDGIARDAGVTTEAFVALR